VLEEGPPEVIGIWARRCASKPITSPILSSNGLARLDRSLRLQGLSLGSSEQARRARSWGLLCAAAEE